MMVGAVAWTLGAAQILLILFIVWGILSLVKTARQQAKILDRIACLLGQDRTE